jgi:hypothetical protein
MTEVVGDGNVRFGSKADIGLASIDVRFTLKKMSALGQKQTSDWPQLMSALPSKADIAERHWDVRFVPKADLINCLLQSPRRRWRVSLTGLQVRAFWQFFD